MRLSLRAIGLAVIATLFVACSTATAVSIWAKGAVKKEAADVFEVDTLSRNTIVPLSTIIKDMQIDVVQVQQFLTDTSATRGLDGLDDGVAQAAKFAEKFGQDAEKARVFAGAIDDKDLLNSLGKAVAAFPAYYENGQEMTRAYVAAGPAGGNKLMGKFDKAAEELNDQMDGLLKRRDALLAETTQRGEKEMDELHAILSLASNAMIFANSVSLLILVGAALGLLRLIIRPILDLTGFLEKLAAGDLSIDTKWVATNNEIGRMARAADVFRQNALERLRLESSTRLTEERERRRQTMLESAIADFRSGVFDIIASFGSKADVMKGTAATLNDVANRAEATACLAKSATENSNENIRSVSAATVELDSSIAEISHQIQSAAERVNKVMEASNASDREIGSLIASAEKVGAIVDVINDIADRTNMLALNATIEAARAGESGRGFAIVASEVKVLAEHTAKATQEISRQIGGIQGATNTAVEAIRFVSSTISEIDAVTSAIAAAVEQQSAATREIAQAVLQASQSSAASTGDVENVARAISEVNCEADRVSATTSALSTSAQNLSRIVESFLINVTREVA